MRLRKTCEHQIRAGGFPPSRSTELRTLGSWFTGLTHPSVTSTEARCKPAVCPHIQLLSANACEVLDLWPSNYVVRASLKIGLRMSKSLPITNYQLPNGPVKAGRRWGQRHPQGANLGSNGILNFLSKLKQWLPPAHPKSLASQCMSGQPISTCHALTS